MKKICEHPSNQWTPVFLFCFSHFSQCACFCPCSSVALVFIRLIRGPAFILDFELLDSEFVSNFEFRASNLFLIDIKPFDAQVFYIFFGEFRDSGGFQPVDDGFRRRPDDGCIVI